MLTQHLVLFSPAPGFFLDTQALHCLLDLSHTSWTYFLDVLCRPADNLLTGADHTQPLQQETEARKNTHHKSQTSTLQGKYSFNISPLTAKLFNLIFHPLEVVSRWQKWNESGFRPPLCTYRLNWARRTSWGWWDDWDDTVLAHWSLTRSTTSSEWKMEVNYFQILLI